MPYFFYRRAKDCSSVQYTTYSTEGWIEPTPKVIMPRTNTIPGSDRKYAAIPVDEGFESGELFLVTITGDMACFSLPEFAAERTSSLVPSHSAANGILSSFLSHKGCTYSIKALGFLSVPRNINITINEISNFGTGVKPVDVGKNRTLRNTNALTNVRYIMAFRIFSKTKEDVAKYANMFNSRLPLVKKGETNLLKMGSVWSHMPYLGIKEYVADVRRISPEHCKTTPILDKRFDTKDHDVEGVSIKTVDYTVPLGIHFYGTDYETNTNYYYPMNITEGLLRYPSWSEVKNLGIKMELPNVASA